MRHLSVLSKEVEHYLDVRKDDVVVDATLGFGGHSLDILARLGESGRLIAFDQDERNLKLAKDRLSKERGDILFVNDNFRYLKDRLYENGICKFDKILFDLGLSSMHIDEKERGFSFMNEGPLDMRFDLRRDFSAYDLIKEYSLDDLTKIFREYGEEKSARKIAVKIVEERENRDFKTTLDLANFIRDILKVKNINSVLARIFQAIRIEVNDEMGVLRDVLEDVFEMLNIDGIALFITFHSVEDRVVKKFFKSKLRPKLENDIYRNFGDPLIEELTKKPLKPSNIEIEENSRSRSAKLRAYKKIKDN